MGNKASAVKCFSFKVVTASNAEDQSPAPTPATKGQRSVYPRRTMEEPLFSAQIPKKLDHKDMIELDLKIGSDADKFELRLMDENTNTTAFNLTLDFENGNIVMQSGYDGELDEGITEPTDIPRGERLPIRLVAREEGTIVVYLDDTPSDPFTIPVSIGDITRLEITQGMETIHSIKFTFA